MIESHLRKSRAAPQCPFPGADNGSKDGSSGTERVDAGVFGSLHGCLLWVWVGAVFLGVHLDFLLCCLEENGRLAIKAVQLLWIDLRQLKNTDAGADDEECKDNGDDLGGGSFEALVQNLRIIVKIPEQIR